MIRSVTIKGYRGLEYFEMDKLGRINLLVGKNNSGKSSVLEALYLLASGGSPRALSRILRGRGELTEADSQDDERPDRELDISHLFFGHRLDPKYSVTVEAKDNFSSTSALKLNIREINKEERKELFEYHEDKEIITLPEIGFAVSVGKNFSVLRGFYRISSRGGIGLRDLDTYRYRPSQGDVSLGSRVVQYVKSESLSPDEIVSLWDKISLTPFQSNIIDALQAVDKMIENIAAYSGSQLRAFRFFETSRGGFKVKLKGRDEPVPIGSLGDGVWRMLAIAISLGRARGGVLLIDEIDTGLHYSVQEDLWRMIARIAKDLDVQVFATTHSYDCLTSLASICHADSAAKSEVTIQRIEAGKKKAVAYDEGDIVMAAERHIEMR